MDVLNLPPPTRFTREDVIDAACRIIKESGLEDVSTRNVARELGSSIGPVYTCFDSIDDLKKETMWKVKELLSRYTRESYTDDPFLNMGTGLVVFARDNRNLFRALFMESSDYRDILNNFLMSNEEELAGDPRFGMMAPEDVRGLLDKIRIFTHGLACFACIGLLQDDSDEAIINTLIETGVIVIEDSLRKYGVEFKDKDEPMKRPVILPKEKRSTIQ